MTKKKFDQRFGINLSNDGLLMKEQREDSRVPLREVTVKQATNQLLATGEIKKVFSVIGAGKEATVLLAQESATDELICAKVFRYFTSTIKKRLRGTHHVTKELMASLAAKQEFWNLFGLHKVKIPVPKPRYLLNNIMMMDFISIEEDSLLPAPLLSDVDICEFGDPEDFLYEAIDIIAHVFLDAHMVHGDYSNDNLMINENGLVTMDVSQSVLYNQKTFINTPARLRIDKAVGYLLKDITNLNKGFYKYHITIDPEEVVQNIVRDLPEKLQEYLEQGKSILPLSGYVPERYRSKEMLRSEFFQNRTGKKYQKRKR
ncbi:MAG: RIO1 family regulatory kinase/ATPase domain-containing protein [Candidatus Hodarchaeales archaeon]|jgi:serine/threonine-protein kinase RIO1